MSHTTLLHRNPQANHAEVVRAFLVAPPVEHPSVALCQAIVAARVTTRSKRCPAYTFKLLNEGAGVTDNAGIRLPDTKAAYDYACDVALELMDHREEATRFWRLDVYEKGAKYENGAKKLCEILFATIDQTLDHLKPDNRKLIETMATRRRSLQDTYRAAWITCRESQALMARSRGKLYLATDQGEKTIRD